jgi:hypothetical protein
MAKRDFMSFDPNLYDNPELYLMTLEDPGVTSIGPAVDQETFELILLRSLQLGKRVGQLLLYRKQQDPNSPPILDCFPVYSENVISVIGDYIFEEGYEILADHVSEAEEFIFSSPKFETISEVDRRINIMRLAKSIAFSDLSNEQATAYVPLIGSPPLQIATTVNDGVPTRVYEFYTPEVE